MSGKWKCLVSEYLGIDVDVSILEANDFLMAQIGVLMKILEDNEVKLRLKDEQRRELAELGAKLDPARGAPQAYFFIWLHDLHGSYGQREPQLGLAED